jgi:acetolactate synthase-1/2/3 large subunit
VSPNGAQSLIRTLVDSGVDLCLTNPGTSEMHFVAALDQVEGMRAVLGLFEGAVTGAADGYARMADRPAATLLHLGPGLGNGIANLHNARRGATPVVNIVGDHATFHARHDAPLQSDIDALASNVSGWIRRPTAPEEVAPAAAAAVAAAMTPPGQVATLILPADASWETAAGPAPAVPVAAPAAVDEGRIGAVAEILRGDGPAALFVGGRVCRRDGSLAAARVAQATGARLLAETFPARQERGAGIPAYDRLAYLAEFAEMQLAGVRHLVVVDTVAPVSFFAYPGRPSDLVPDDATVHVLAEPGEDGVGALEALADLLDAPDAPAPAPGRPGRPSGALTGETVAAAVGAVLPDRAIVVDEAATNGIYAPAATAGCPPHDWLSLTGGAIGFGIPAATGAAVACPDRPVVNLQADGSAMYTIQALWTQAREGLDVTTVIYDNRSYAVLNMEMDRVGAREVGPKARAVLDISDPDLDFVALGRGLGVDAERAEDAAHLTDLLERALAEPGPHLIDAPVPNGL